MSHTFDCCINLEIVKECPQKTPDFMLPFKDGKSLKELAEEGIETE